MILSEKRDIHWLVRTEDPFILKAFFFIIIIINVKLIHQFVWHSVWIKFCKPAEFEVEVIFFFNVSYFQSELHFGILNFHKYSRVQFTDMPTTLVLQKDKKSFFLYHLTSSWEGL